MTYTIPGFWTQEDAIALAKLIMGEARGEPGDGQAAVAWVAIWRSLKGARYFAQHQRGHPLFGSGSISAAVYAPRQFSCFNEEDPKRRVVDGAHLGDPVYVRCMMVAFRVLLGDRPAPPGLVWGQTLHYANKDRGWPKAWGDPIEPCAEIGRHLFYAGVK